MIRQKPRSQKFVKAKSITEHVHKWISEVTKLGVDPPSWEGYVTCSLDRAGTYKLEGLQLFHCLFGFKFFELSDTDPCNVALEVEALTDT